jgi:hypothetical protein
VVGLQRGRGVTIALETQGSKEEQKRLFPICRIHRQRSQSGFLGEHTWLWNQERDFGNGTGIDQVQVCKENPGSLCPMGRLPTREGSCYHPRTSVF